MNAVSASPVPAAAWPRRVAPASCGSTGRAEHQTGPRTAKLHPRHPQSETAAYGSPPGGCLGHAGDARPRREGRGNAGIAAHLHLSESSVEKHVNAIFTKLGLTTEDLSHRRVTAVLTFLRDASLRG